MDFAIIVKKYADGLIEALRSTRQPPPPELETQAKDLDHYLQRTIPRIEGKLTKSGLLSADGSPSNGKAPVGNVALWYALGLELGKICERFHVDGRRERRWLWEAIANLYATEKINRAQRGRTRNHFEYCYRLSRFPKSVAARLNWSEWVYFFDSLTVREEGRADQWIMKKAQRSRSIERRLFRRFTENLNRRIKVLDTSVLDDAELFQLYDSVWKATNKELRAASANRNK